MKKMICLIALILFAREDPFELKMTPKTSPQSVEGAITKPLEKVEVNLPTTARILKEVQFVYQKLDGSIATETIKIDSDIDWHYPISLSQIQNIQEAELKKPVSYKIESFGFTIIGKTIQITSPYKLEQIFVLPKPFRIILDLQKGEEIINQDIALDRRFFRVISVGTHKNYYRISLELDGQYAYDLGQNEKGYTLTLR
ncbi:AMIN domain-containing protein [Helicobacter kayseriensis]|uniref:AMIN domain-containing protein n=1 Tax=Helicobacter kayseriensis TaxID=2905877 RepID=UPI001E44601B|nr:AMIN domain-containing protein [Helicobacter kayseriensis]MCE3047354.1 AMIN domain-containing protein [Helicobacter kayseriensis]MCE3048725.1 AMIN domain-containing protein [Helicobacter kayseriensis]